MPAATDGVRLLAFTCGWLTGPAATFLSVQLDAGAVVLAADACDLQRTVEDLHLPAAVFDEAAMVASLRRLRAMRDAGARLFYGHDPEFRATVPQASQAVG
jgi:N-acyl homoserine lactone hydrolase